MNTEHTKVAPVRDTSATNEGRVTAEQVMHDRHAYTAEYSRALARSSELTRTVRPLHLGLDDVRIHVSAWFARKEGKPGVNVAFSFSNDLASPEDVARYPMLMYRHYTDSQGLPQVVYTDWYTLEDWQLILDRANKDGDALVFYADVREVVGEDKLMHEVVTEGGERHVVETDRPVWKGYRILVDTVDGTDEPFSKEEHIRRTREARVNHRIKGIQASQNAKLQKEASGSQETEVTPSHFEVDVVRSENTD